MNGIRQKDIFKFLQFSVIAVMMMLSGVVFSQDYSPQDRLEPASVEIEQVNINRADAATMALVLDGVGLRKAEAIVTFREEFGEFDSLDELLQVNGIGEATLRNNEQKIRLD